MGIAEIGFYFLLEFWASFYLGIPNFEMLKFRKSFLLKIQILRCHGKMCRLFLCIPIFRGFFYIKKCKKMCMCVDVKNRIVTCEQFMFWCEKGYKLILALGSPKT